MKACKWNLAIKSFEIYRKAWNGIGADNQSDLIALENDLELFKEDAQKQYDKTIKSIDTAIDKINEYTKIYTAAYDAIKQVQVNNNGKICGYDYIDIKIKESNNPNRVNINESGDENNDTVYAKMDKITRTTLTMCFIHAKLTFMMILKLKELKAA